MNVMLKRLDDGIFISKLSAWDAGAHPYDLLNQFFFTCTPVMVSSHPHPVCTFLQVQLSPELNLDVIFSKTVSHSAVPANQPSLSLSVIVCIMYVFVPSPSVQSLLLFQMG